MGPVYYEIETIGSGFLAIMAKPVAGEWIDEEQRDWLRHNVRLASRPATGPFAIE